MLFPSLNRSFLSHLFLFFSHLFSRKKRISFPRDRLPRPGSDMRFPLFVVLLHSLKLDFSSMQFFQRCTDKLV
jgi:hypothetical protein